MPSPDSRRGNALRVVLVGTGTGVGKTHVACALLVAWRERIRVTGLKPIETGIAAGPATPTARPHPGANRAIIAERAGHPPSGRRAATRSRDRRQAGASLDPSDQERLARAAGLFHVKQPNPAGRRMAAAVASPRGPLFAFPEPISPHLAAGQAGVRIDPGAVERWVRAHEAPVTIIETAGGLFSPLGHGSTNFELLLAVRPQAVILVAPDRLGVLHDLTATLGFAAARGGPELGVVLSTPAAGDASTGRNAAEIVALGIARPIAVFPRADERDPATLGPARAVIAWIEARGRSRND